MMQKLMFFKKHRRWATDPAAVSDEVTLNGQVGSVEFSKMTCQMEVKDVNPN